METNANCNVISKVARMLNFGKYDYVEAPNYVGGLAIFWCPFVKLSVVEKSTNFIFCKVADVIGQVLYEWDLLLFYGSPYIENRERVWSSVDEVLNVSCGRMLMLGDFNQVEYHSQKLGGSQNIMGKEKFMLWRQKWQLVDIPFHGVNFTWCNNRTNKECIYERLDRGYATDEWYQMFPEASILNLPILVSDHSPIILETVIDKKKKGRVRKIESWCLDMDKPKETVAINWKVELDGSPMYKCSRKLQKIKYDLFTRCKEFQMANNILWDDIMDICDNNQQQLQKYTQQNILENIRQERKTREECFDKALIKLAYWKQRAKGKWIALGDSNTSFFFRCAKHRKTRNAIKMIQSDDGNWVSDSDGIKNVVCKYFKNLFKADECVESMRIPDEVRNLIPKLDSQQIARLDEKFTKQDVKTTVFQMSGLKAPGPDGIPAIFYHKAWGIIGKDITEAVLHFFRT
ncbi:uncharacterized protein [Spinacia oleracea]|uniref:Endonuclease/exonuclease/phosphatase domain-containing protein n=1 Tax=Spinacia oleracea TaxID=3562 RepID=A0A9R0I8X2_SPIOL|nr:uncharacterized protein LOC110784682 [Spinacia oleracea]